MKQLIASPYFNYRLILINKKQGSIYWYTGWVQSASVAIFSLNYPTCFFLYWGMGYKAHK